jgi:hypothetical protein
MLRLRATDAFPEKPVRDLLSQVQETGQERPQERDKEMNLANLVFVDCEARGTSPVKGTMTEFGAVHYLSRVSFHGRLFEGTPDPENPAIPVIGERVASDIKIAAQLTAWLTEACPGRVVMVSDNPAYDFMWIAALFDKAGAPNPFGHSARRISDFWSGLNQDWSNTQGWKRLRKTKHDHNPVNDAMGNVEAFEQMIQLLREGKFGERG